METGKTVFLGEFEHERVSKRNIHKEIFSRNGCVYICPYMGRHIHIWNLADQTMRAIEIRSKDEKPYAIDEIYLDDRYVFLLPDQKKLPVKKMNLNLLSVTETDGETEIQGKRISDRKEAFPAAGFMKEWHIDRVEQISWIQGSDKIWRGFLPLGRHILYYLEEWDRPRVTPLAIVNGSELEKYLHKVRTEVMKNGLVFENIMNVPEFAKEIVNADMDQSEAFENNGGNGNMLWEMVRDMVG